MKLGTRLQKLLSSHLWRRSLWDRVCWNGLTWLITPRQSIAAVQRKILQCRADNTSGAFKADACGIDNQIIVPLIPDVGVEVAAHIALACSVIGSHRFHGLLLTDPLSLCIVLNPELKRRHQTD